MHAEDLLQYTGIARPSPGGAVEVAPGVHWARMPLPFALDHINLWLLEDGDAWVLVDTGLGNDATRALWEQLFSSVIRGRPVSRILVTHHHPDHVGNTGWLMKRVGAPLWMSQSEYLTTHALCDEAAGHSREGMQQMFLRNGLGGDFAAKLFGRRNPYRDRVPDFPSGYRRLVDGEHVRVGGRDWRVVMGYGHAPEHAALYSESLGVLISGDMVLPRISTNVSVPPSQPEGNPLKLFLQSIDRYAQLPADTLVLPSHGEPFRGLRERVAQLQEHHRLRLGELLAVCDAPKAAAEVLTTLFRRQLDTHQTFFAMGEAMAHLHYLHEEGRVSRTIDASGVARYTRI